MTGTGKRSVRPRSNDTGDAGEGKQSFASSGGDARRATLKDVAGQAGVSVATVSRVLTGNYPVSVATRNRVMRAVRQLDYVVNAHARALQVGTSGTVAFVLEDITGPSFAEAAAGVEEEAARYGRICVVCTTHGSEERQMAVIDLMRAQGAEAVILIGGSRNEAATRQRLTAYAQALAASGSRLVLCGRPSFDASQPVSVVDYDNEAGAYAATSHLVSQGHRKILFVGGPNGQTTAEDRRAGYVRGLESFGIEPDPQLQIDADFSREAGRRGVRQAVDRGIEFTAVFAATDVTAAGVMQELRTLGLRVPEDISLVGYDDIPLADDLTPRLTTVRVPYRELGAAAVRAALDLNGSSRQEPSHVVLGTHLVIRESVAPPLR